MLLQCIYEYNQMYLNIFDKMSFTEIKHFCYINIVSIITIVELLKLLKENK